MSTIAKSSSTMVQLPTQTNAPLPNAETSTVISTSSQAPPNWDILSQEWLSDEPELESDLHRDQIDLLLRLMRSYWRDRNDVYCSGNTTVYYDESQQTTRNFRGPDLYIVLGSDPRPRKSWMIWREGGKYPNVVIEMLSDSTAKTDRTTKKELYQNIWRLPNYFWFHPYTQEFQGFRLANSHYEAIQPNDLDHLWSDQLELFLGIHQGVLRLFTPAGTLIPLPEEAAQKQAQEAQKQAQAAQKQAQEAQKQAQEERQEREALIAKLREQGIDVENL